MFLLKINGYPVLRVNTVCLFVLFGLCYGGEFFVVFSFSEPPVREYTVLKTYPFHLLINILISSPRRSLYLLYAAHYPVSGTMSTPPTNQARLPMPGPLDPETAAAARTFHDSRVPKVDNNMDLAMHQMLYAQGQAMRRRVMGNDYVDQSLEATKGPFMRPLIQFATVGLSAKYNFFSPSFLPVSLCADVLYHCEE